MISSEEIKVIDKNSEFYGTPASELMENAGRGLADFIKTKHKTTGKNILFFCGTGNNGGDGLVAARYLGKKGYNVKVFLTGENVKTKISQENLHKLKKTNTKIYNIDSIDKIDEIISLSDTIVDSMLGIGLTGSLREPYKIIVNKINLSKNKTIVVVDIPTGFGTSCSVKPDYTVTFHDVKNGMNKNNCGDIITVDIKVPQKAKEYVGPGELVAFYPIPKKNSHKGENGRLLIVGGGPYYGAPALSSFAAQRAGVDLVYVATPKKVARAITSYSPLLIKPVKLAKNIAKLSPTLIVKELKNENILIEDDVPLIESLVSKVDTLLIGPGLGSAEETQKTVKKIVKIFVDNKKSIVIDADAIKVVGRKPDLIRNSRTVLTPHTGEFKELTNIKLSKVLDERKKHVENWANKFGVTILLKGPVDIISNGKHTKLNDVHNQAMTVGGTGDVLAGVIGALLSKNVEPFNAARIGAFINGYAGNLAFKKKSYGLIATDVIEEIPNVLKSFL